MGPSLVTAAAVGQHSQTRVSTAVSEVCFAAESNVPKRTLIAPCAAASCDEPCPIAEAMARPSSQTSPSARPGI